MPVMSKTTSRKFREEATEILKRMRERTREFSTDPDEQEERLARAEKDFLYFCATYLPHYFDKPFDRPMKEWAKLLDIENIPVFVIGPPDSGKSTFFEIADTLHRIVFQRFKYGVIGCHSLDQSGDRVEFIRMELDENPRIIQDFGELKGRRWERDDFITNSEIRLKAISFKTRIYGLTFRNWRPDYCRLSDIEDEKTVGSPRVTQKIYRWITQALIPRFREPHSIIYNGNKLAPKMALVQLAEQKDEEGNLIYPGGTWPLRKRGRCQFPHLWTEARIEKQERALGTTTFARVYDFLGIDDDRRFRKEWFITEPPEILIGTSLEIFGGIDPSPEPNAQLSNDQKAIVIIGIEKQTITHVIDAWIKVASVEEMISAGYELHDRWQKQGGFRKFLMKGTKVEEMYRKLFDEGAKLRGRMPLPIHFENETTNKIVRLGNRLPSYIERGLMRFVASNGNVSKILDEAELFPDGKMDGLDALDMALQAAVYNYSATNLVVAI